MVRFLVSAALAALIGSAVPAVAQTSIAQLDRLRLEWADLDANDPWTPRGGQHWGKPPWQEDWIHFTLPCRGREFGCEGESLSDRGAMVRTDERDGYVLRREGRFNGDGTVDMGLRADGNSRALFDLLHAGGRSHRDLHQRHDGHALADARRLHHDERKPPSSDSGARLVRADAGRAGRARSGQHENTTGATALLNRP